MHTTNHIATLPAPQPVVARRPMLSAARAPAYQPSITARDLRALPARNLWSRQQCLLAEVNMGQFADTLTTDLPGFTEALLAIYPALIDMAGPLRNGCFVAEVIARLTLHLQAVAGAPPAASTALAMRGPGNQATVIVACQQAASARRALLLALGVVDALGAGLLGHGGVEAMDHTVNTAPNASGSAHWRPAGTRPQQQRQLHQRPPTSDLAML